MLSETRAKLISQLKDSQKQLSDLLASVVDSPDWQPHAAKWSFRYIAAHLATGEKECLGERLKQMATGEHPSFGFYLNSERDFSGCDLMASLQEWARTRREVLDFVRGLPEEKLALTASHAYYGTLSILDYLKVWLEHDQDHLCDLEQMIIEYKQQKYG